MRVKKLSHASLEISGWGGTLVTDPWFEGTAFADSWALHEPPATDAYETLSNCTLLWVSHGHPDHFSPLTLLKIPQSRRCVMKVLILDIAANKPLIHWFERQEFEVVRMRPRCRIMLSPGLQVEAGEVHFGDSWMWLSYAGVSILNLNDCVLGLGDLRYLSKHAGRPDLLALQYGVANWTGNAEDYESSRLAAIAVLARVERYVRELKPATVLPFASEFKFSQIENQHLNDSQNSMADVESLLYAGGHKVVTMGNGDTWSRERGLVRSLPWVSSSMRPPEPSEMDFTKVPLSELQALSFARAKATASFHGSLRTNVYRRLVGLSRLGRVVIHVLDTHECLTVRMESVEPSRVDQRPDLEMSSEMLAELIGKFYGVDNLFIGGRFRRLTDDALLKLGFVFGLERLGGMGIHLGVGLLRPTLIVSLFRRWRGATGRWRNPQ
jgi:UDP-MurNAc hydroxylase